MALFDDITTPWEEPKDLFSRREYAQFLTNMLDSRPGPYVMNLNASWGTGKTFFLRHWAKSLEETHKVVYINSWESDFSDDPLLAVMSAIEDQLVSGLDNKQLAETWIAKGGRFMKAIAPTVLAGVTRKFIGEEAFEDVSDNLKGISSEDEKTISDMVSKAATHVLADHQAKEKTIVEFKDVLTQAAVEALGTENENAKVLVFVDELDRCRPSYAIEMLESIKHLYSIKRMAFVVATDSDQLQHAIRAIYGSGFHGEKYLRRFFDTSFSLPDPNYREFATYLVRDVMEDALNAQYKFFMPNWIDNQQLVPSGETTLKTGLSLILAFVAEACGLDLRSTAQAWTRAEVILLENNKKIIDPIWLLSLLAIQARKETDFELITTAFRTNNLNLINQTVFHSKAVTMRWLNMQHDGLDSFIDLTTIVRGYSQGAINAHTEKNRPRAMREIRSAADHAYQVSVEDLDRGIERSRVSLSEHLDAVRLAGHIR